MIETLFFIALAISVVYVLMPLYQSGGSSLLSLPEDPEFSYLEEKRATVYTNLKDLDLDFAIGKVSEVDYQRIRSESKEEAAKILTEMDKLDLQIERELQNRPFRECSSCGKPLPVNAKFCPECGGKI
ncbi:MAG: zinc ribbon domain-containing protein [Chlamydiae bacterium]|nr:zinc ribbon domain-containing protein [Chlamydiota bacterium]MBI3276330.1 zinc ribbon domain-containing protein [Chlamydiota bacterium]